MGRFSVVCGIVLLAAMGFAQQVHVGPSLPGQGGGGALPPQKHVGPTPPGTPSNGSHQQVHVGPQPPQTSNSSNLSWQTISTGQQSRATGPGMYRITSEAEYQQYHMQAFGNFPQNPVRGINFQVEQLVAVHLGPRNTSGFSLGVLRVRQISPTMARIVAEEQVPSQYDYVAQQVTSPWVLIKVQRGAFDLSIQFQRAVPGQNGFQIIPLPDYGWCGNGGY